MAACEYHDFSHILGLALACVFTNPSRSFYIYNNSLHLFSTRQHVIVIGGVHLACHGVLLIKTNFKSLTCCGSHDSIEMNMSDKWRVGKTTHFACSL